MYINELSGHKNQIIGGYPGGTFGPADDVLAAQLITMVLRAKGYTDLKYYQGYVDKALELGLVKKGEFDSYTRVITRAEIARVIARAVKGEKFPENLTDYKALIKDFDSIPENFREDILKVYYLGIVEGGPGGYNAGGSTSRAAASKMILAMLEPKYRAILQPPTKEALGLGVMVHYSSGQYWYVTLPIAPTKSVEAVAGVYKQIDHAGGCFLDNPKKSGEVMETYIIRGLDYSIMEPEAVELKVWLVENLDQEKQLSHDSLPKSSWGRLILDKELVFTPEKPYAVEKITYAVPQKGRKSGIIVQTGTKSTVESYTWHTPGGNLWYGSHTTSKESIMDWLPWDSIKAEYGISRGK